MLAERAEPAAGNGTGWAPSIGKMVRRALRPERSGRIGSSRRKVPQSGSAGSVPTRLAPRTFPRTQESASEMSTALVRTMSM